MAPLENLETNTRAFYVLNIWAIIYAYLRRRMGYRQYMFQSYSNFLLGLNLPVLSVGKESASLHLYHSFWLHHQAFLCPAHSFCCVRSFVKNDGVSFHVYSYIRLMNHSQCTLDYRSIHKNEHWSQYLEIFRGWMWLLIVIWGIHLLLAVPCSGFGVPVVLVT